MRCERSRSACSEDRVRHEFHDFSRLGTDAVGIVWDTAKVDFEVATFDPTKLRKRIAEFGDPGLISRIAFCRAAQEHADPPRPLALLRPSRQWPCRRAAKSSDEFAPS